MALRVWSCPCRPSGVSNYKVPDLEALKGDVPSVNQCLMSVSLHDDKTIDYCAEKGITYEACTYTSNLTANFRYQTFATF